MRVERILVLAAVAAAMPFGVVCAAPQILALVATDGAVALECREGKCAADFSAICLQRDRVPPSLGTAYTVTGGENLRLFAAFPDGTTRMLASAEGVSVESVRGFSAVRISVPANAAEGATALALEVGGGVSLVPVPLAGDPDPQSAEEVALYTGALREAAAWIDDPSNLAADAARITNRLNNALRAKATDDRRASDSVFEEVMGEFEGHAALSDVRNAYRMCAHRVARGFVYSTRYCMQEWHDGVLSRLNQRYWELNGPGS